LTKKASKHFASTARCRIAREAATLLYFGMEKEYKQAKLKAAANLGTHVLPSNLEIALELDKVAQETEGSARTERLIQMSVWRGSIHRGSDIDIEAFHDAPQDVVLALGAAGLKIQKTELMTTTEHGKTGTSLHIHCESTQKHPVEVVVRAAEEKGQRRKCDTFGDEIKGLTIQQLEKLLGENSSQQFLPE
jgi:predicted nucleotidyltransferase